MCASGHYADACKKSHYFKRCGRRPLAQGQPAMKPRRVVPPVVMPLGP
jgi:hypothetical protein